MPFDNLRRDPDPDDWFGRFLRECTPFDLVMLLELYTALGCRSDGTVVLPDVHSGVEA